MRVENSIDVHGKGSTDALTYSLHYAASVPCIWSWSVTGISDLRDRLPRAPSHPSLESGFQLDPL